MKRLRLARKAFGYTIDDIATNLALPAGTVKAWETGEGVPTSSELRDLAMFYGTSIDDLTGDEPLEVRPVRSIHLIDEEGVSGFWGHLGVLIANAKLYRWYSIDAIAAETVATNFDRSAIAESGIPSLSVETLNNRLLWINLANVKAVCLCQEAEEWPEPCAGAKEEPGLRPAEIEAHPSHLYPPEFYQVMTDRLLDEALTARTSDSVRGRIDEFLDTALDRLTDADIERLLLSARVWMVDGTALWISASSESLKEAMIDLDVGVDRRCLHLRADKEGHVTQVIPLEQVGAIELPSAMLRVTASGH